MDDDEALLSSLTVYVTDTSPREMGYLSRRANSPKPDE